MTKLNKYLKEVEARCEAATEGPWEYLEKEIDGILYTFLTVGEDKKILEQGSLAPNSDSHDFYKNNSIFKAHARTDVEALLEMVKAMQPHIKHLNKTAFQKWVKESEDGLVTKTFYPFKELQEKFESLIPESNEKNL